MAREISAVVIGETSLALQCARILIERGHHVRAVVSDQQSLVAWAAARDIPVIAPDADLVTLLPAEPFDYLLSIVNSRILPAAVLARPRRATINFHDAPLPRYAGTHATSWALMAGESRHGVTWHVAADRVDAGAIVKQVEVPVAADDTAFTLNTRCYEAAVGAFGEMVDEMAADSLVLRPQQAAERSFFGRFRRPDAAAVLSWEMPARDGANLVRALEFGPYANPLGRAKVLLGDEFLICAEAEAQAGTGAPAGTVVRVDVDSLVIATTDGNIALRRLETLDRQSLGPALAAERARVGVGDMLPGLPAAERGALTALNAQLCRAEAFWVERLRTARPVPSLPEQRPSALRRDDFRTLVCSVPDEFRAWIAARTSANEQAAGLIGAVAAYLFRVCDVTTFDLDLAANFDGASLGVAATLIARHVPLRVDLDSSASFDDATRQIATELALVSDKVGYLRDVVSRYPALNHPPVAGSSRGPVAIRFAGGAAPESPDRSHVLTVTVDCDAVQFTFTYAADALSDDAMARMVARLQLLLRGIAANSATRLGDLPLVSATEHQQLIDWNATTQPVDPLATLHGLVAAQAARTPDAVAVVDDTATLTYAELMRRAAGVAASLRRRGVGPGMRVAVFADRHADMVPGLLGILASGAAYVPVDPDYPIERIRYLLDDAEAAIVLTDASVAGRLPATVLALWLQQAVVAAPDGAPPADDVAAPAYLLYTSGSTGRPKGAVVSHRALVNHMCWMQRVFPLAEGDVVLQKTPVGFDASVWEFWAPLLAGATLRLAAPGAHRDPAYLASLLRDGMVTTAQFVPTLLQAVLDEPGFAPSQRLRRVFCGGEPLTGALVSRWRAVSDAPLVNLYGPTETTIDATSWVHYAGEPVPAVIPIGRPIANMRAYVLDSRGATVPIGVPGELYLAGAGVADGYLHRPELTAERFLADPLHPGSRMYRTGDRVRHLPAGDLEYLGRLDTQVKLHGHRVELGEVETALSEQPGVGNAVAMVREDAPGEPRLAAYVAPGSAGVTVDALRAALRSRLPDYMVPSSITILEVLPTTPNGKVDRNALPVPAAQSRAGGELVAPRTALEAVLARIWCDVLWIDRIGVDDNYYELGGDSIRSMQIAARATRAGVPLTVVAMSRHATIAELARAIASDPSSAVSALAALPAVPSETLERLAVHGALEDAYPLAPMQLGILFHALHTPGTAEYHVQVRFTVTGELHGDLFRMAWDQLVQRHAVLRTGFAWEGVPTPLQVVHRAAMLPWHEEDWRGRISGEQATSLAALAAADGKQAFELLRPPLMRITVVRTADTTHEVLWSFHHLLLDGWSVSTLLRELGLIYDGLAVGAPADLGVVRPYRDYVALLQRRNPQAEAFWRGRVGSFAAATPLAIDRKVSGERPRYQDEELVLSPVESGALQSFAREHRVTVNTILQAAWALLLSRYSGEEDVVFGATVTTRPAALAGVEEMTGLFLNTLPVRVQVRGDAVIGEWLRSIHTEQLEVFAYDDTPLVEIQRYSGVPAGHSLFESLLVFESFPGGDPFNNLRSGLTLTGLHAVGRTNYPLTLVVIPGKRLGLTLIYDETRFERPAVRRMLGHLRKVLDDFGRDASTRLGDLEIVTGPEARTLTRGPALPSTERWCLHQRFEQQVVKTPHRTALTFEQQALTYAETNARANRLARRLRDAGVGPDVLVGLCAERSIETVIGVLAILKAGGAYLPLDPSYPQGRLEFMLDDSGVKVLLTQDHLRTVLPAHRAQVITITPASGECDDSTDAATNLPSAATPDHLAYVIYTSGSTGKPKGALITHANVARLMDTTDPWFQFGPRDVWTLFHSFAFDFSVWEMWGALLYGGKLVVVPYEVSRSPELFLALTRREGVTVLNQTPSAFRQFAQAALADVVPHAGSLRYVIFGGEALELQGLRQWFACFGDARPRLVNMFGITETTVHVTYRPVTMADVEAETGSVIGVPLPDLAVYLLNPDGRLAPIGVPGEIHVGGPGLARGYLSRPELTAQRFIPNPFVAVPGDRLYRTGDLARLGTSGDLEYLGRIDHQVKIRGFRIELGEIEAALAQYPGIRDVVVMAREDSPGDKRLVAYVVLDSPDAATTTSLRAHCLERLPDYMVPAVFVSLDVMPITSNGKIDRRALPAPPAVLERDAARYVAPRTPREELLARIWAEVLRVERVGVDDNYFELGGDSILSIQIAARARDAGCPMTVGALLKHATIAELATVLEAAPAAPQAVVSQEPATGSAPLTPIQHWFFEADPVDRNHWNQTFLFRADAVLDPEALRGAVRALLEQHDALRLRFASEAGTWHQHFADATDDVPFDVIDLAGVSDAELPAAISAAANRTNEGLDIGAGPCLRVALLLLGDGRGRRISIAIHHLVVDGVSWRILREDLESAYRQLAASQPMSLPRRTASYQRWANVLAAHADSTTMLGERAYWHAVADGAVLRLPTDYPRGDANRVADAGTVTATLDERETAALLQQVPSVYATQINDILVAALADALAPWAGSGSLVLELEGHGREEIAPDVDTTRTVGWFTSIFPFRLALGAFDGVANRLKATKEQLRTVPRRGIGYGVQRYLSGDRVLAEQPQPEIVLNYLGQFDQVVADSALFAFADEDAGMWTSPRAGRRHLLEISALVLGGRLELRWRYGRRIHRETTVSDLAERMAASLRETLRHCLAAGAGGRTPSDFPLVSLTQHQVDALVGDGRGVEEIGPLAPMQALFLATSAGSQDVGFEQWHYDLDGEVNCTALRRAWEYVVDRHASLRAGFEATGLAEPVQVIHRRVELPFRVLDWRGETAREQDVRFTRLLADDRAQGFDVARPPLLRLTLVRFADRHWKLVWSNHHLLLERWSVPLVLRDVGIAYQAFLDGHPPALPPVTPWRRYLAWLSERDRATNESFWRTELAGVNPAAVPRFAGAVGSDGEQRLELSAAETARLVAWAREHRVTVNTVVSAVWAVWLARATGAADVVFGLAVAGRSEEVPGITELVGMCLNNLPVRLELAATATLASVVHHIAERQAAMSPHEYTALADLQRWSGLPWHRRLFDTLLVFQHHRADDDSAGWMGGSVVATMAPTITRTNFPLALVVGGRDTMVLRLAFQGRDVTAEAADLILREVGALLADFDQLADTSVRHAADRITMPGLEPTAEAADLTGRPAGTDTEWVIERIWADLLGRNAIGIDDSFMDLGGQSLVATQIVSRVRDRFQLDLPVALLFAHPTVARFAAALAAKEPVPGQVARIARIVRRVEEMSVEELGMAAVDE